MKKILEILPTREVLYEMPDEVFIIFDDLAKKTISIRVKMYFHDIYKNLPEELKAKITVKETPRPYNDLSEIESISLHREEVQESN